jgi:DNA repair protein RadC
VYVRELRVHYRQRRVIGRLLPLERLVTPREAALAFGRLLRNEPVEVCGLFCLATGNQVLAYHELSRGTVDASLMHPRDILKIALLANATAVIVGHNHPSGDPTPSADDIRVTQRLKSAGDIVGIELVDHIVIADDRYLSFKDSGLL